MGKTDNFELTVKVTITRREANRILVLSGMDMDPDADKIEEIMERAFAEGRVSTDLGDEKFLDTDLFDVKTGLLLCLIGNELDKEVEDVQSHS